MVGVSHSLNPDPTCQGDLGRPVWDFRYPKSYFFPLRHFVPQISASFPIFFVQNCVFRRLIISTMPLRESSPAPLDFHVKPLPEETLTEMLPPPGPFGPTSQSVLCGAFRQQQDNTKEGGTGEENGGRGGERRWRTYGAHRGIVDVGGLTVPSGQCCGCSTLRDPFRIAGFHAGGLVVAGAQRVCFKRSWFVGSAITVSAVVTFTCSCVCF